MNLCVRNMINLVGLSIQDAIKMATLNPAKVIGVDEKKGSLVEGKNADLVVFDKNINILTTAVKGKVVFSRKSVITPLEEEFSAKFPSSPRETSFLLFKTSMCRKSPRGKPASKFLYR